MKFFVVISSLLVLATARPDISQKKGNEYSKPPADFNQNNYFAEAPLLTNHGTSGVNSNEAVKIGAKSNVPSLVNSNEFSTVAPPLEYSTVSPLFKNYEYPSSGSFLDSFNGFSSTPAPLFGNVEFSTPTPAPFVSEPRFEYSTPAPLLNNIELSSTPAPFFSNIELSTPNTLFGGDFSSYGSGFDYVSSTAPPFYENSDFSPSYFGNDYSGLFNGYYNQPQAYQSFQNGFNTNAGFATGPVRHINVQTEIVTQAPIITKNFYIHDIPEDDDEIVARQRVILPPPQKHVKIIFIKAPTPVGIAPSISIPQVQNEEKTIVYVLVKKPQDIDQEVIVPQAPPTPPSKPEVYFIKYKGNDPAETIKTIQNQYASNNVNKDGSLLALSNLDPSGIVSNIGSSVQGVAQAIQGVLPSEASFPSFVPSLSTIQNIYGGVVSNIPGLSLPQSLPLEVSRFSNDFGYGSPFYQEGRTFLNGNFGTSTTEPPVLIGGSTPNRFSEPSDSKSSEPKVSEPASSTITSEDSVSSTTPTSISLDDSSLSTGEPISSFPSIRIGGDLKNDENSDSSLFNIPLNTDGSEDTNSDSEETNSDSETKADETDSETNAEEAEVKELPSSENGEAEETDSENNAKVPELKENTEIEDLPSIRFGENLENDKNSDSSFSAKTINTDGSEDTNSDSESKAEETDSEDNGDEPAVNEITSNDDDDELKESI